MEDVAWTSVGATQVVESGILLGVELGQRPIRTGQQFMCTVTVGVPEDGGTERALVLATPGGSSVRVLATSLDDGGVGFDSLPVDKEVIASQPQPFTVNTTETIGAGESWGSGYVFTITKPGRYAFVATTFGPKVATPPLVVAVP